MIHRCFAYCDPQFKTAFAVEMSKVKVVGDDH